MKDLLKKLHPKWFSFESSDLIRVLKIGSIYFILCMNYTILRNLKDSFVITHPELGIEAIPFLRTWVLFPAMFVFTWVYIQLSNYFSVRSLFIGFLTFFSLFFLLFILYLYPERDHLIFSFCQFSILRHWMISLYYVFCEVWGTVMILILFWGYVNQHSSLEEAKRLYPCLLLCANLSGIAASQVSLFLGKTSLKTILYPLLDSWSASLSLTTCWVITSSFIAFVLFISLKLKQMAQETKKESFTFRKSFGFLFKEKRLWVPAVMVFSYFFSTGILELLWKNDLKQLYHDPNDFNNILNRSTYWISLISTLVTILLSGSFIRRLPTSVIAALTPALLLLPLSCWSLFSIGVSSRFLQLSALMGVIYYCMNRITKFTFFDLSKELICVPLSISDQTKAKAALDGVLPKFAKLSESVYLQGIVFLLGSFQTANTLILVSLVLLHAIWLYVIVLQPGATRETTS